MSSTKICFKINFEFLVGLLDRLLESESYGERRGAAYGLAGLVKGLGILTLKQQSVISILNESIQDKKVLFFSTNMFKAKAFSFLQLEIFNEVEICTL